MTGTEPRFRSGAASDTGRIRNQNQDAFLESERLFVVADGMGGHQGGEVASQIAVDAMRHAEQEQTTPALLESVQLANRDIVERADEDPALRGMGTTLCAIATVDTDAGLRLAVVNVGDSRVYRFVGDQLRQVTEDHSLVETLVRDGRLSPEEAAVHPQRNILTRALGVAEDLDLDWWELPLRTGDRYVLCSDGLFNELSDDQIAAVLRRLADPADAAAELVRLANDAGGRDNTTVVVADVIDGSDASADPADDAIGAPTVTRTFFADDPEAEAPDDASERPSWRRRLFGWKSLGYLSLLVAVAVAAIVAIGVYARSSFFVDVRDDEVVILQGRPGGVLWFDPTFEEGTGIAIEELTPALLAEVVANPEHASLDGAREYVDSLLARAAPAEG